VIGADSRPERCHITIEKSTAGASVLAQVIVSRYAAHLPLHRQAKMFARHGFGLPDQTLYG
jgi:transposase